LGNQGVGGQQISWILKKWFESQDLIELAKERSQWQVFSNMVLNLQVL
jgi:hypothetical protein